MTQLYELNGVNVKAEAEKHEITSSQETWKSDPDKCCAINKVEPLEVLKDDHRIWVSGLMK
ncbi:MAG: phosphoadenosine phosphosulfate reductase [Bacteroidia bacterium]